MNHEDDGETFEDLVEAAGLGRRGVGRAAEKGLVGTFAALTVIALIVSGIASFVGSVGLVLKVLGAPFMETWDWGTLILMLVASVLVCLVLALFLDS